jgi:hypothetical protein
MQNIGTNTAVREAKIGEASPNETPVSRRAELIRAKNPEGWVLGAIRKRDAWPRFDS